MVRPFDNPVFCALDTPSLDGALSLARAVASSVGGFKIGMEAFYALGRDGYREIAALGRPIFLDLKLHDIPATVAGGLRALADLAPAIVNVHALGGRAMMEAARTAAGDGEQRTRVIAVTVLTSLDDADLAEFGIARGTAEEVVHLATMARAAGLEGVVCAGTDIASVKQACGRDFLTVVPGIRPAGADRGDQKRILTPAAAVAAGADILVIGRPISQAADPAAAAAAIAAEIRVGG